MERSASEKVKNLKIRLARLDATLSNRTASLTLVSKIKSEVRGKPIKVTYKKLASGVGVIKLAWDCEVYDSYDYTSYSGDEEQLEWMNRALDIDDLRALRKKVIALCVHNHRGLCVHGKASMTTGGYFDILLHP